jgi:hypothetical protein
MASKKSPMPKQLEQAYEQTDPKVCRLCQAACVRGDFSSVANFGVTREPHFVTSYGWMQVKYDRATAVDAYMCLNCGNVQFFGRQPLAVLGPLERQQYIRASNPALARKMELEEKRRKEKEQREEALPGEDHLGV